MKLIKYIFAKSFPLPASLDHQPGESNADCREPGHNSNHFFFCVYVILPQTVGDQNAQRRRTYEGRSRIESGLAWNFKQWTHQRLQQNANDFQNAIVQQERHEDRSIMMMPNTPCIPAGHVAAVMSPTISSGASTPAVSQRLYTST